MAQPGSTETARPGVTGRPTVAYVLGAGRSGSTILGVALGNCAGVFFAGELDKWLTQSGEPMLHDSERVNFWKGVRALVNSPEGLFGYQTRCLERSSALFHPRSWPARRRLRGEYRRVSQELYLAIARATHATHILDSSHYPLRAREMQSLDGIDLYLIYLVRDPHDVVRSLARKDVPERSFGLLAANAYLWLTHIFAVAVFLAHPRERRVFVRYEDLTADPEGVLVQVLARIGSEASVPDTTSLRTGVPLHGNRLVREPTVALTSRQHKRTRRLPVTTLLQSPWAAVFHVLRPSARRRSPNQSHAEGLVSGSSARAR